MNLLQETFASRLLLDGGTELSLTTWNILSEPLFVGTISDVVLEPKLASS